MYLTSGLVFFQGDRGHATAGVDGVRRPDAGALRTGQRGQSRQSARARMSSATAKAMSRNDGRRPLSRVAFEGFKPHPSAWPNSRLQETSAQTEAGRTGSAAALALRPRRAPVATPSATNRQAR